MRTHSKLGQMLFCTASLLALGQYAVAEEGETFETVVVTGSRTISSIEKSPTPLTELSAEQLQMSAPSSIPDALNKLPVFQGSVSPSTGGGTGGQTNGGGNVVNLRNFGANRTLVLMDGHRVVPSNADGTVDLDTLPQMLVSKVDIVTGGASAVYGSDAITGVVNFVLDKDFTGLKVDASAGISDYGDGAQQKFGMAWGTSLFGGRGHFEGSARYFHQDLVLSNDRPYGLINATLVGAGTPANPYSIVTGATQSTRSFGGYISCTAAICPANAHQFVTDSSGNPSIATFNAGTPTVTAGISTGGDGGYFTSTNAVSGLRSYETFGRFSYNLNDTTQFYVQATWAEAHTVSHALDNAILAPLGNATYYVSNPYLPSSVQSQFGSATTFNLSKVLKAAQYGDSMIGDINNRNIDTTMGVSGTLHGDFTWDIFYTHGENRLSGHTLHDTNNQRLIAANDAVKGASGNIICNVLTTTSASKYAGCVPINPFGGTISQAAYDWITSTVGQDTSFKMDNIGGSIAGTIFELPAGPVKAALSGEARWLTYVVYNSTASSTAKVDCTDLRLCSTSTNLYVISALAPVRASDRVWEFAAEADVPLVKDVFLVQDLSLNVAGRFTNYKTSGAVETWKVGFDWHLTDDVRFRATNSVDIRAPTLSDLYLPPSSTSVGFVDNLTNTTSIVSSISQGNTNLVPEISRTYTAGIVLTPSFIPGLTASLDYYQIKVKNAIGSINGTSAAIQNMCIASGGTSPYCALYVRPTPTSYPTAVLSQSLNAAMLRAEGWDFELNYISALDAYFSGAPGTVTLRALANYQPMNQTQQYAGAAFTTTTSFTILGAQPEPKTHATFSVQYQIDDLTVALQDRWISGVNPSVQPGVIIWKNPSHISSFNTIDINVNQSFQILDGDFDAYFNVQNLANATAPLYTAVSGSINQNYPTLRGEDRMGRFYTLGIRAKF